MKLQTYTAFYTKNKFPGKTEIDLAEDFIGYYDTIMFCSVINLTKNDILSIDTKISGSTRS